MIQYGHGMTVSNKVEISNVSPTTEPAPLTAELGLQDSFIVVDLQIQVNLQHLKVLQHQEDMFKLIMKLLDMTQLDYHQLVLQKEE